MSGFLSSTIKLYLLSSLSIRCFSGFFKPSFDPQNQRPIHTSCITQLPPPPPGIPCSCRRLPFMELSGFLRKFESLRSLSTFMLLIWSQQSLGIQVKLLLIAFLFTCATYFSMLLFCSICFPIAFILLEIIYEHRKHLIYCRRVI